MSEILIFTCCFLKRDAESSGALSCRIRIDGDCGRRNEGVRLTEGDRTPNQKGGRE